MATCIVVDKGTNITIFGKTPYQILQILISQIDVQFFNLALRGFLTWRPPHHLQIQIRPTIAVLWRLLSTCWMQFLLHLWHYNSRWILAASSIGSSSVCLVLQFSSELYSFSQIVCKRIPPSPFEPANRSSSFWPFLYMLCSESSGHYFSQHDQPISVSFNLGHTISAVHHDYGISTPVSLYSWRIVRSRLSYTWSGTHTNNPLISIIYLHQYWAFYFIYRYLPTISFYGQHIPLSFSLYELVLLYSYSTHLASSRVYFFA